MPDIDKFYAPAALIVALCVGWVFTAADPRQEHGPEAKCTQWCTPDGERHDAPEGMTVVKCAGSNGDSCAKMGAQCGNEHRAGCSEFCRIQCCSCCSI